MTILTSAVLVVAVFTTSILFTSQTPRAQQVETATVMPSPVAAQSLPRPDPEGTIDGAKNPEKIPTQAAYSLFFRFLSGRHTKVEKDRAKAYLQMYFGATCDGPALLSKTEMDALLASAEEFAREVSVVDRQSTFGDKAKLTKRKETLVADAAASLSDRLGAGAEKVRLHLNDTFKRKVKFRPSKSLPAKTLLSNHATSPPSGGYVYTYSDVWLVNNSGTTYDPELDEWQMPDTPSGGTNEIVAVGVTETDYNSSSESVHTTLSGPSGNYSASSYVDPWYSRAELGVPISNSEDPTEYEWTVNTSHTYYGEPQPVKYNTRDFGATKVGHRSRPLPWYYTVWTYVQVRYAIAATGYASPIYVKRFGAWGSWGCRYRARTCDSNCRNPSTWTPDLGIPVPPFPSKCLPYAKAWYLTWRISAPWFSRGCVLFDAIARTVPGDCTPRTWP